MAKVAGHRWLKEALFGLLASCAVASSASAGDFSVMAGGAGAQLDVVSFAERRFGTIVRQEYDFSCGSAALATLLTFHYNRPTTERDAFANMWAIGEQNRIRELGFSLLEMKRYIESLNLKADGFRLTLDRIQEIGVPGIALIDLKGYRHFVVIKGVTSKTVLIGDPSSGVVARSRKEFEKHWDGTVLFIRSDVALGRANFNKVADWALAPSGPYDRAVDPETLQSFTLNQTRPSFSGFSISTTTMELP